MRLCLKPLFASSLRLWTRTDILSAGLALKGLSGKAHLSPLHTYSFTKSPSHGTAHTKITWLSVAAYQERLTQPEISSASNSHKA